VIRLRVDPRSCLRWLKAKKAGIRSEMPMRMRSWSQHISNIMRVRASAGPPGLTARSGGLAESFTHRLTSVPGKEYRSLLYSTSPYARSHEESITIVPKGHPYLAIPITGSPAVDSRGAPIYKPSLWNTLPPAAWQVRETSKGIFLGETGMGSGFGYRPGTFRAWYKLVTSVRTVPRLQFHATVRDNVMLLSSEVSDAIARLLRM